MDRGGNVVIVDLNELADWWNNQAREEFAQTAVKAKEYSSSDLRIMGAAMEEGGVKEGYGEEAAIAFYVLGKVARAVGALQEGQVPSDDTWFDISVYAKMVMRIRETGRWP